MKDMKIETVAKKILKVENLDEATRLVNSLTSGEATQILISQRKSMFHPFILSVADTHYALEIFVPRDEKAQSLVFNFTGLQNAMSFASVMVAYQDVLIWCDGAFNSVTASDRPLAVTLLSGKDTSFVYESEY